MTSVQRAPIFPDGIDGGALLRPLQHSAWTLDGPAGAAYRRAVTRASPLLFALTYLGRYLRGPDGDMAFSAFHMDAFARARGWSEPVPRRDVVVAPRGAGKSVLYFLVLPLWALAHGHRRFMASFSYTEKQARGHLGNVLDILHGRAGATSDLLLADFPELAPVRGAGGPRVTVLAGGPTGRRAVAAYGMGESALGLRLDEVRPDLLVGDDIEPGGDKWSAATRRAVLAGLLENILPMNRRAVVQVVGTVTADGSVIHDAVRAAQGSVIHDAVRAAQGSAAGSWVREAGFAPHWYPAIVDEGGPGERSLWPQQWPLEQLKADRVNEDGTLNRAFALTMMNDPVRDEAGAYWSADFRYAEPRVVRRWVAWVDPALSTHDTSDHTAIVVAGLLTSQRPAVVVAEGVAGHWSPAAVRDRLAALRTRFPGLQVCVEVNALGSEEVARQLYGLEHGDLAPRAVAAKALRIRAAADLYREGLVVHARPLAELEAALVGYGSGGRDDLEDALAGAVGALLPGRVPA